MIRDPRKRKAKEWKKNNIKLYMCECMYIFK